MSSCIRVVLAAKRTRASIQALPVHIPRRQLSSSLPSAGELLRVAVVGGGAAGLSAALHLAPLVSAGKIAAPIDVYDAPPSHNESSSHSSSRNIGVGIWSTALDPFLHSDRTSHQVVYQEMTNRGSWLGDVGYRTPNGAWLMKSHLPTSHEEAALQNMPGLLFLREKDMIHALEKAVHWEQQLGTVRLHRDGNKTRTTGLQEDCSLPWSTKLAFDKDTRYSDRDYHLVIAADGTHSVVRQKYGGHHRTRAVGALSSPMELPQDTHTGPAVTWHDSNQQHAVGIQDRNYTVFRGNSPLNTVDLGPEGSTSFQTWGVDNSMRFATVPMHYRGASQKEVENQVWFVTISNDGITSEPNSEIRRDKILEAFQDWHDPICRIIQTTPPEEILMTRAIAHRYSVGPVVDFNTILKQTTGKRPPSAGEGPCLLFTGDACMTIDPILAQGFTFAMEGAYMLYDAVEKSCVPCPSEPLLAFDPNLLRGNVKIRHEVRLRRLICLLQVTELVQALGQPRGDTLAGRLNRNIVRPLTRLTPNVIKAPIFNAILKYSLNCHGSNK
jgi:2-polyprenyl-6-methoxyphenol hydroxylase-like FAD-dependent oxidoreductase